MYVFFPLYNNENSNEVIYIALIYFFASKSRCGFIKD